MVATAIRIEPTEDNLTYFAQADEKTVTLRHYNDQTVFEICNGILVEPKAGEQIQFPIEHLHDVIAALCEILHKRSL